MEVKPGTIPDGWLTVPLGQLCKRITTGKLDANAMVGDGDYPFFTCARESYRIDKHAFDCEALLVSGNGANVGYVHYYNGKFNAYQRTYVLSDFSADVHFLRLFLDRNLQDRIRVELNAGNTPYITMGTLTEMGVVLPTTSAEQRAIAEALSDVDGLLGGLDRLIAKKRDLKQAAMQQLLTGQTRLPGFHGEWETQSVAELEKRRLVKLSRGKVISKKDIESTPGDFPIYSSSVHNDGLFGRYGHFMFEEELITWSVDGGGHFFHRPKHKFSVTNVCGFMRVDTSRISYRFFAAHLQLLHSRKSFDYQSKAHPSVIRKEYEVQLPSLAEQTAIAEVLTEMDVELAALEQRREKTRALKQAMMQELLTGRTRLVARGETENPEVKP